MDSSFSMSDDSSERTIRLYHSPVASPVARKRPSSYSNHDDDDDYGFSMEVAPRVRRSHRVKTPNTFFDPGMGEPDSLWVDKEKNPRTPVEHVTRGDNVPCSATGQPTTTMSHVSRVDHGANTTLRDFLPIENPNLSLVVRQGRQVVTFPSSRSMDYIADVKKAWVVEKMTNTLFKYLDEKSWKESIQEKVEVALADMASNGKNTILLNRPQGKHLPTPSTPLIWRKNFPRRFVNRSYWKLSRPVQSKMCYTALAEWILGWMSPMRSEFPWISHCGGKGKSE
jgi:hypothetical protein